MNTSNPSTHLIRLEGRLDANRVINHADSLLAQVPEQTKGLIINLSKVTFIDSSGLGYLVSVFRQCESANRKLAICEPTDQARMLFELTRMHQIFSIYDHEETALKQLF
jgi:anti-sigma B factor antagonist